MRTDLSSLTLNTHIRFFVTFGLSVLALLAAGSTCMVLAQSDSSRSLTPLQAAIQEQQSRLGSQDAEDRRDALMRLSVLRHPAASRVAVSALGDTSPAVRVAAASAVLWLPPDETAQALLPLLKDKDPFVRQEAAYALGKTRSRVAVTPLIEFLASEKTSGARGAAVVSLGLLRDETAVVALSELLSATRKRERNEFVLRAAARSLGQIGSRAGVPALLSTLENEKNPVDIRREAAVALGAIKAPESVDSLRRVIANGDPYLALAAEESLRRMQVR